MPLLNPGERNLEQRDGYVVDAETGAVVNDDKKIRPPEEFRIIVPKPYKGVQEAEEHRAWLTASQFRLMELPVALICVVIRCTATPDVVRAVQASVGLRTLVWNELMSAAQEQKVEAEDDLKDEGADEAGKRWEETRAEMQRKLDGLRPKDLGEVRCLISPPSRCNEIAEIICRLFMVKPETVVDPSDPRRKIKLWWRPFVKLTSFTRDSSFIAQLHEYLLKTEIQGTNLGPVRAQLQMMEEDGGVERTKFVSWACYCLHEWALCFVRYWDNGGEQSIALMRANCRLQRLRAVPVVRQSGPH